jgi:nucleoside-diphosphate-sugar epimerase
VEIKNRSIGIISLGWLGEKLALELKTRGASVWGTVSTADKAESLAKNYDLDTVVWQNEQGLKQDVKSRLISTEVLILNLPPSVFKEQSYACGLLQFLPYLNDLSKVIFTSSTSVYPNDLIDAVENHIFKENEKNKMHEAESKLTDKLGDKLCILRLAGLIGEDRHPVHFLVKKEINDHPDRPVNLIHRKDVINVIVKIIQEDFFGEILNVCHPSHPTRKAYYSRKATEYNLPLPKFAKTVLSEKDKIVNCEKLIKKLVYSNFEEI